MDRILLLNAIILATLGPTTAQYSQYGVPSQSTSNVQYGPPSSQQSGGHSQFFQNFGSSIPSSSTENNDGPKIYKHISIHVPPEDEFETPMKRVIRPMEKPDKIVNIIFVKAPSTSSHQQTEIILPEQPQPRTVVYVLLKKSELGSDIQIKRPEPMRPPKPEVFFIKYKRNSAQSSSGSGALGEDLSSGGASGGYN